MVSSRGSGSLRGQTRVTFRPNIVPRRKPSETVIKSEPEAAPVASSSSSSSRGRGDGRGRGGRGGGRGGRREIEQTASGPFALGTGSVSARKSFRPGGSGGASSSVGKWDSSNTNPGDALKPDPTRRNYRDPDQLRAKEEYSDQEESDVEIVDLEDVRDMDIMAPRALPRVEETKKDKKKKKKPQEAKDPKGKGKVKAEDKAIKSDPDDVEASERAALGGETSSRANTGKCEGETILRSSIHDLTTRTSACLSFPVSSESDDERDDGKVLDALDLSDSEEEEMMDDLVDDFVFDEEAEALRQEQDGGGGVDGNRYYLFQLPQLFPEFVVPPPPGSTKPKKVAFTADTRTGSTPPASDKKPSSSSSTGIKREGSGHGPGGKDPSGPPPRRPLGPEGQIGNLHVYKDGRVEMHFGDIIMEITAATQSTFLQEVAILDEAGKKAYMLGELQRKFTVSPNVENMLDDYARHMRLKQEGNDSADEAEL